jgi:hypothetical protein
MSRPGPPSGALPPRRGPARFVGSIYSVRVGSGKTLEYMTASDLIEEPEWRKYNRITGHKEMKPSDADNHKGATINLEIEWKNNTWSYEDLPKMIKLDADMCYKYALDNNLLGKRGWGRLDRKVDKKKLMEQQVNVEAKPHAPRWLQRGLKSRWVLY